MLLIFNERLFYVYKVANCLGYNNASHQLINKYLPDNLMGVIIYHTLGYERSE